MQLLETEYGFFVKNFRSWKKKNLKIRGFTLRNVREEYVRFRLFY